MHFLILNELPQCTYPPKSSQIHSYIAHPAPLRLEINWDELPTELLSVSLSCLLCQNDEMLQSPVTGWGSVPDNQQWFWEAARLACLHLTGCWTVSLATGYVHLCVCLCCLTNQIRARYWKQSLVCYCGLLWGWWFPPSYPPHHLHHGISRRRRAPAALFVNLCPTFLNFWSLVSQHLPYLTLRSRLGYSDITGWSWYI